MIRRRARVVRVRAGYHGEVPLNTLKEEETMYIGIGALLVILIIVIILL